MTTTGSGREAGGTAVSVSVALFFDGPTTCNPFLLISARSRECGNWVCSDPGLPDAVPPETVPSPPQSKCRGTTEQSGDRNAQEGEQRVPDHAQGGQRQDDAFHAPSGSQGRGRNHQREPAQCVPFERIEIGGGDRHHRSEEHTSE